MSAAVGFFILAFLVSAGLVFFALCHGDRVKTGFRVPGVQLFLSYQRDGSKQPASDGRSSTSPPDRSG